MQPLVHLPPFDFWEIARSLPIQTGRGGTPVTEPHDRRVRDLSRLLIPEHAGQRAGEGRLPTLDDRGVLRRQQGARRPGPAPGSLAERCRFAAGRLSGLKDVAALAPGRVRDRYNSVARPFSWIFTRTDFNDLLHRIDARDKTSPTPWQPDPSPGELIGEAV
jgi:hypothetical protein